MAPGTALAGQPPTRLMPFAYDWVGGDIHGLSSLAGTLYGYPPNMADVVTALDKKVSQVVSDAGWQGSAASSFSSHWEQAAAETNAVGLTIIDAGDIVNQLAVDLAKIENALESAADQATAHGVTIGSNGQPPQACYASQAQEDWREGYDSFYQQCLADLLATPSAYAGQVAEKVKSLTAAASKAKQAWLAAQAAARQADGRFGVMPDDVKQALKDARTQLASAQDDLTVAQGHENAVTKVFDTRTSDLPGLGKLADGLADDSILAKALDVPVLGVAAGVAAGGVVAYGVGDYVHNYIEDFGQQWHQHGVLGIATHFGAAGVGTWDDTKGLVGDIGGAAKSVWHDITSLF